MSFCHFPRVSADASFLQQEFLSRSVFIFWSIETAVMRSSVLNHTLRRILCFPFFSLDVMYLFENCTLHYAPKDFVSFRKIELDFSGSISWKTQTNYLEFFNMATESKTPICLGFFYDAHCHSLCA